MNNTLNKPFRKLNLIEFHNELSVSIPHDIDKEKDIYQKSSKCSDDLNSIKMQLRLKIKLIIGIVMTLMVPQTSKKVLKMVPEGKR